MFNDPTVRALLLSVIAGMSTLVGAIFVFFIKKKSERLLSISLGFAAGVMISVSFTDLFPIGRNQLSEAYGNEWGVLLSVLFLGLGIVLSSLLDKLVPHQAFDKETGGKPHNNLFKVGFISMLAIGIHNFPEGIATFMAGLDSVTLGISLTIAIALHNIPEGIAVAMPIYFATGSRKKAFLMTFYSGVAEPLGAILAFLVLKPFINDFVLGAIFSLVSGIMIYISIEELIPSSRQYGYIKPALIATFAGICIMPLTLMF